MVNKNGFTMMEMLVVLVIVGMLAAISIPGIIASIEQTKAQTAQNNLMAIAAAQSKYYEDHANVYCPGSANMANPALFTSLGLSMTQNDNFIYTCTTATSPYSCTAQDTTDLLTLNPQAAHPVICTSTSNNKLCPANLPSS